MYKCSRCHSTEVEALSWIDLNTGEEQDGEVGEYYCRSCGSHTDVYSDFVDSSILDDDSKELEDEENN